MLQQFSCGICKKNYTLMCVWQHDDFMSVITSMHAPIPAETITKWGEKSLTFAGVQENGGFTFTELCSLIWVMNL